MEASGAGQAQDPAATDQAPAEQAAAPQDAQQTGTGVVVICGQYEPGSIVTLHKVAGEGVLRAEGSPVVGQRIVDDAEEVGFDGLEVGARYIAAGYTRGRYEEVSATAHDINDNVELMQPPERPIPATLGTQNTSVQSVPAAPSENAADLGTGLPEGVTSPMLGDREAASSADQRDDAQVSPGDVDGVAAAPAAPAEQAPELYLHLSAETVDDPAFEKTDLQTPAETAADGSSKEPQALYRHTGDGDVDPAVWQRYEGVTESAQAAAAAAPDTAAEAPAASSADAAGPAQATTETTVPDTTVAAGGVTVSTTTTATPTDGAAAPDVAPTTTAPAGQDGADQATGGAPATSDTAQAGTDVPQGADGGTDAASAQAPTNEPEPAATGDVPAPQAGTPDASDSSGTGQANGGAVEPAATADRSADPSAPASSAAPGGADGSTSTAAATDGAPAADVASDTAVWDQLVKQAEAAGVDGAKELSDAQLRQAITEKGLTPVV